MSSKEVYTGPMKPRCAWVTNDPLYLTYHDAEWGVPLRDDGKLFELLVLETFQAGLSWLTVLKKRENFRAAFHGFDAEKIAQYGGIRVTGSAEQSRHHPQPPQTAGDGGECSSFSGYADLVRLIFSLRLGTSSVESRK